MNICKRFFFITLYLSLSHLIISQTLSEPDIEKIAKMVNDKWQGVDLGNGITVIGCNAIGRTLVYRYEMPDNWTPIKDLKSVIITNFKNAGFAENLYKGSIIIDNYFYKGTTLLEKVSIYPYELSAYNFELGDYISIKDHKKSKGVNLKLKAPIGWEIKEGDRPNIINKFNYGNNYFTIMVAEAPAFLSRKEAKEILLDVNSVKEFMESACSSFINPKILDHKYMTVDTYPTLEFKFTGSKERLGIKINLIVKSWMIFYEDKFVTLSASGDDNNEFKALEYLYLRIINSIIFPDQYN